MGVKERYEERYGGTATPSNDKKSGGVKQRYEEKLKRQQQAEAEEKRLKAQSDARQKSREERSRAEKAAEQLNVPKKNVNAPSIPQSRQPVKTAPFNRQLSYQVSDSELNRRKLEYDRTYEQVRQENPTADEATIQKEAQIRYNRAQNARTARAEEHYNREFAKEHPVIGTVASFGSNLLAPVGLAEIPAALVEGREIDPNAPAFRFTRQTQDLRSGAMENIEENADTKLGKTLGKGAYQLGTTLGDMALSRAITAPLGGAGYAANMAMQAASSTAQDGAERGLSNGQIMTETITSAALIAVLEKYGFDKVFKPQNAATAAEFGKNIVKGFAAEGFEEATEELGNTVVDLIVGGEKSALFLSAQDYMSQGYSQSDAYAMAIKDAAKQIGSSFVIGGLSGGIMAGVSSAPGYVNSVSQRVNGALFPNQANDVQQTAPSAQNVAETQANTSPANTDSNIPTETEDAVTQANSLENEATETAVTEEDGVYYFYEDDEFDTEALVSLNDKKAQSIAEKIEASKAVISDKRATPEQKNAAQSELIKSEYDAEAYDGVTGEKTETYTSGKAGIDALVNTNGRLNKTVTVDTQAEQKLVDFAANKFGRTVRFVDTLDGANAYFDKETGVIFIARDSQEKFVPVFGHEYLHTLEGTSEFLDLKEHLQLNSAFIQGKIKEAGSWETAVQNKITQYENSLRKKLSATEAENELIADAIANEWFSDYSAMESLAMQRKTLFARFKQWFTRNFIGTGNIATIYANKRTAAKKTYALLLQAEKAAVNGVQNGEGVAFSAKSSYDYSKPFEQQIDDYKNVTESQQFKHWFGDWQKRPKSASKIVNADGTPKVMYHGTPAQFTAFDKKKAKSSGFYGRGFYFTDSESHSKQYGNTMAVYLDVKNPLKPGENSISKQQLRNFLEAVATNEDDYDIWNYGTENIDEIINKIYKNDAFAVIQDVNATAIGDFAEALRLFNKANGTNFDGIVTPTETVVFEPTQIKSSTDNIGTFDKNNPDIRYSAKKPEIITELTEQFGYDEASANNIYKAARIIAKKAGSEADIEQLTSAIASSLESRNNGEIDSESANRIAMMIAESSQTINEDFVTENKPILDYLKGAKLTLSDSDIDDLGDSFAYVKGKLSPYVALGKGEGNVNMFFQDLAAKFPNEFRAGEVTRPADQVKVIMSFIENYRDNYYYRPYFEDDAAFQSLRSDILELLNSKLVDDATYIKRLEELVDKYGELKNNVPKSTDGETRVRATAATIYGTDTVRKSEELKSRFTKDFVCGKWDYVIMRQSDMAFNYISKLKSSENVADTVLEEYSNLRRKLTDLKYRPTPEDITKACALNEMLGDLLNADDYVEFAELVSGIATTAGQISSSIRIMGQLSGAQKVKIIEKEIARINQKQGRFYEGETETDTVADENGQFKLRKKPKGEADSAEVLATTKKSKKNKYPPIKLPAEIKSKLYKAKTKAEVDEATRLAKEYVAKRTKTSWFDKFNAWRYFAMLGSPLTPIRNIVSNISMSGTARLKDVVAAALERANIASDYKKDSVQTTAAITTKDARRAALELLVNDNRVFDLTSGENKYTGRSNFFKTGESKANKLEKKIAEHNPLVDIMLRNRSIMPTDMATTKIPILNKALTKLSDAQQKALDDTPFKVIRAKSVMSQAITANMRNGEIQNLNDFIAVALNQNTSHLDNETKIKYARLYDAFCQQAAAEADEATFRDESSFANAVKKFANSYKAANIAIGAIMPFHKTPANVLKRSIEYSPAGYISVVEDRVKLSEGTVDRNTFINDLAKGLTGTGLFATGVLLAATGLLTVGDDGEEDEAKRTLEGGQEYALNFGDKSYTISFLSPVAIPLFMGGRLYETITNLLNGDEVKAGEFLFSILEGVAEPMFAQTMLDGVEGAFDAISRQSAYDDSEGESIIALLNYCCENWTNQLVPSALGAVTRISDDTVRTYYTETGNEKKILDNLFVGIQKKVPGIVKGAPAKLNMWGEPVSTGNIVERVAENLISPGYYQEGTKDEATKAITTFAEDNNIAYSDIIPQKPQKYFTDSNGVQINLTADEYEKYAGIIGAARKEAVEKYIVRGEPVEITYEVKRSTPTNASGLTGHDVTFYGSIANATNSHEWAPTSSNSKYAEPGDETANKYITKDDSGKVVEINGSAPDETFRRMLYDKLMERVTEEAQNKAKKEILADRKKDKE